MKGRNQKNLVGPTFRTFRLACKPPVSQDDVAGRLAVLGMPLDRSAVSRIESQDRHVTDVELYYLARALKLPVSKLWAAFESAGAKSTSQYKNAPPVSEFPEPLPKVAEPEDLENPYTQPKG